MPSSSSRRISLLATALSTTLAGSPHAIGAPVYWDGLTGGGNGSSDVWDTATANWNPASDYSGTAQLWNNSNNDTAVFAGTAGAVSLGTGITVGGLSFETDGYSVSSSTLTFAGASPGITAGSGVSATISSGLAGSSGLTKSGDGTVVLTGGNSLGGNIAVDAGTLQLNGSRGFNAGFFGGARTFTIASGATLDVAGTWNTSSANVFTLNGGTLNFSLAGAEPNANYVNNLNVTDGTISGNAFRTGNGAVSYNFSGDAGSTISAELGMVRTGALPSGTITLNVADGAAADDLTISGRIHDVSGFPNSILRKAGSGTLLLANAANSFTGNVVVAEGILKMGAAGSGSTGVLGTLNTAVSKVTVESGATIDFNGHNDNTYGYTIAGTGVGGVGALSNSGGGIANNFRQATNILLAADASIGGTGNWSLLASGYGATSLDTGGFTLTKTGSNTIGLVNTTVSGGGTIQVSEGRLALGPVGSGVNGAGTALLLDDTAGVSLEVGRNSSIGSLAGGGTTGGNVTLSSGRTLTVGGLGATTTFSGVISGAGALSKTGTGTLTLDRTNTFTGGTTISQGILALGRTAAAGTGTITLGDANTGTNDIALLWTPTGTTQTVTNNLVVDNQGTGTVTIGTASHAQTDSTFSGSLTLNRATTLHSGNTNGDRTNFEGVISGTVGTLTLTGEQADSRIVFNGSSANTYTGDLVIESGTLQLGVISAARNYIPDTADVTVETGATMNFSYTAGGTETIGALHGAGTIGVNAGNTNRLHIGANDADGSFGGLIQGGAKLGLTKVGAGTQTLTGANTYAGATVIEAGTLLVNNSTGSGTGSSLVNVTSAGTLGGTGTIAGNTTVSGTLAPGASPGTLSFTNDLGLNSSAILDFELDPADMTLGGGINDLLAIGGALTLDGLLNVTATSGDFSSASLGDTWTLATYSGSLVDNGLDFGSMPTLANDYEWEVNTSTPGTVNLTVIPEPRLMLLGSLGLLGILRRRRTS